MSNIPDRQLGEARTWHPREIIFAVTIDLSLQSIRWHVVFLLLMPVCFVVSPEASARPKAAHDAAPAPPLNVSPIDRLGPQGDRPAFNSLDERRRGPIFAAALRQVSRAGKLPPVNILNRDLSLPTTVPDEPKLPANTALVRIYLTQWTQTSLSGAADSEILCRFYVEVLHDGRIEHKLGPFFARRRFNVTTLATAQNRWDQFQAVAKLAIEDMAPTLKRDKERRRF